MLTKNLRRRQAPADAPVSLESPTTGLVLKKRKRKKKVRLPKNYDPTIPPDPERWLPRKERSYYRGRRRDKRKEQVGRGTQGAAAAASDL